MTNPNNLFGTELSLHVLFDFTFGVADAESDIAKHRVEFGVLRICLGPVKLLDRHRERLAAVEYVAYLRGDVDELVTVSDYESDSSAPLSNNGFNSRPNSKSSRSISTFKNVQIASV